MTRLLPAGVACVAATALLTTTASLAAQRAATAPEGWTEFTRRFDALSDSAQVVGAGVVFVRDGQVVARHAHGLADRTRNVPVTERSIFHYGSITKTLTAIAVMQLRDRGRLTLDDRITRWVPELRQLHDPYGMIDSITIRMLLSHSAGFQNPTWPYGSGKAWEPFEPTTWNQLVAMMPYQELVFRPGSRYGYSNPAYIYLARVIEAISGDAWEAYIQKNIFAPLGLHRSYFGTTPYYLADARSSNYTVTRDSATRRVTVRDNGRDFDPGVTIPNSGWNAPLDDLATYAAFLTHATRGDAELERRFAVVLSRSTLEEMWKPVVSMSQDPGSQSMGLGFFVANDRAPRLIGHTGSQAGYRAFLWVNPAASEAIIVALNTDVATPGLPTAFGPIQDAAMRMLRGRS